MTRKLRYGILTVFTELLGDSKALEVEYVKVVNGDGFKGHVVHIWYSHTPNRNARVSSLWRMGIFPRYSVIWSTHNLEFFNKYRKMGSMFKNANTDSHWSAAICGSCQVAMFRNKDATTHYNQIALGYAKSQSLNLSDSLALPTVRFWIIFVVFLQK